MIMIRTVFLIVVAATASAVAAVLGRSSAGGGTAAAFLVVTSPGRRRRSRSRRWNLQRHQQQSSIISNGRSSTTTSTSLNAAAVAANKKELTERQLQFWEDVDDGLDDIEEYYMSKTTTSSSGDGDDDNGDAITSPIERIRTFAKSARGDIDPPTHDPQTGHEPSEEHVEGLTAQPYWDVVNQPDLFPWATKLEENAHVIQKEFQEKLLKDDQKKFASDSVWQNQVMGTGWSAIRLQRLGVWNTENCEEFPRTYELLRDLQIPLAVRGVCFARQAPNTGVQPHSDGRNFILTSHLGLQIPPDCWIEVGNDEDENNNNRKTWEENKLITIDTSFTHSTSNPSTTTDRHVLIIDFWHPELTESERTALEFVYDLRNKFESGLVPYRKPRSLQEEGMGLAGLWKSLTGGGGNDDRDDDE